VSLTYALATTARQRSKSSNIPQFLELFAALVPGEILAAHGVVLAFTTETVDGTARIVAEDALKIAFVGLILASMLIYAALRHRDWQPEDWGRMFIPPAAFVGWTMLQSPTAFDAVCKLAMPFRIVLATLLALILGAAVTWLKKENP
jgi:hypothetical protein